MVRKVLDWLDDRAGWRRVARAALDEPIPGGSRWMFVTGSGLVFAFAIQAITGIVMAMYFSPSTSDAWGSVYYLQNEVRFGWLVRGLHHFGASAMVVLAVVHMVQVFVLGAYKRPRELNWLIGVLMLFVVLGFALTGYLLPWDQKGYWATQVATRIMGTAPVLGPSMQALMQSGTEYGNLTITRFYALHVFVMPGALIALLVLHVALFRRHGVTPSWRLSKDELAARLERFWPAQVFKDTVYMLVIVGVLLALAIFVGAPLDAPADPSSNYDARPEWYFLFLFQILKYFEGPMALIGTIVIPTLGAGFLLLLPFLDRGPSRAPSMRKPWFAAFFTLIGATVVLTAIALVEDSGDAEFKAHVTMQEREAELAREYARAGGIDPTGAVILYEGHRIFEEQRCLNCHKVDGRAEPEKKQGFELTGYLSRDWFRIYLKDPSGPRFCGGLKCQDAMPAPDLTPEDRDALVELLASQSGLAHVPPIDADLVGRGVAAFDDNGCTNCHTLDGTALVGPTLQGFGSVPYLRSFLADPGAAIHFGQFNDMPAYPDLAPAERDYLIAYLRHLSTLPMGE